MKEGKLVVSKIQFILSMIIFGTIGLVVRHIPMESSEISLISSGIGFLFLLFIFLIKKRKFFSVEVFKKNWYWIVFSSIALAGNWIFLYASYQFTSITNATLAYYFAPVLVMIFSIVVLKEEVSLKKIICVLLSLVGLFLIVQSGLSMNVTSRDLFGVLLGFIAAFFYASLMISGKYIKDMEKLELTILQLGFASFFLLIYVFLSHGFKLFEIERSSILFLILLGLINTGVGFWLFFSGMQKMSGQTIAMLSYVDPFVAILISGLILKEQFTLLQVIGGLLLLGSTFVSETRFRRTTRVN